MQNQNKTKNTKSKSPEFLSIAPKYFDKIFYRQDRRAVWIKLYLDLLTDYKFCELPDETKWHFIGLMMLASETNNRLPNNQRFLIQKLSATNDINLNLLLDKKFLTPFKKLKTQKLVDATDKDKDTDKEEDLRGRKREEKVCGLTPDASDFSENQKFNSSKKSDFSSEDISDYVAAAIDNQVIKSPIGFKKFCEAGNADREIHAYQKFGDEIFWDSSLINEIGEGSEEIGF